MQDRKAILREAADKGNVSRIREIIEHDPQFIDASVDKFNSVPMHMAAIHGCVDLIDFLMLHGCRTIDSADVQRQTPVHATVYFNHPAALEALVRWGCTTLEAKTRDGLKPMHMAVEGGYVDLVMNLHYLGVPFPWKHWKTWDHSYDEEKAESVRYRVYFQESLLSRVLRHHTRTVALNIQGGKKLFRK